MTSTRDLPTWLHSHCSINEVLLIEHFSTILQFFESRDIARDIARDFFYLRWASLFCFNLVVVTKLSQLQF